jgi:DNA-binding XRE family transcriptional regulator
MPIDRRQLAKSLRAARERADLTQSALADIVGVSTETISRIERGAFEPSLSTAHDIAVALAMSLDTLLGSSRLTSARNAGAAEERQWLKVVDGAGPQGREALMTIGRLLAQANAKSAR